ncbi:hypothetical protein [Funiculus sociatus]|uniref:hypothetical protein n=1 Tax=Funiculus sociatus TaxID=450527 RepID=UPI0032997123
MGINRRSRLVSVFLLGSDRVLLIVPPPRKSSILDRVSNISQVIYASSSTLGDRPYFLPNGG